MKAASRWATVLVAVAAGCASVQTALNSKEDGTAKVYPVTESQAWEIAHRVFRWEGADAIEEDRDNHVMMTSTGTDALSYGAVMACWIEPAAGGQTKVTVVTKRRYQLSLFTTLTETTFHHRFAQAVEIVKEGRSLPLTAPATPEEPEKKAEPRYAG